MAYKTTRIITVLAAFVLAGCSSAEKTYAPRESLLKAGYDCADCPEPPFAARYKSGGKRLTYIAALHESGAQSGTFRLIASEFSQLKPQLVIVEGIPGNAGENNQAFIPLARQNASAMESFYAVSLALDSHASFAGGEPSPQDTKARLLNAGYTARDIFAHGIVQEIPVWKRLGQPAGFSEFYAETSANLARMYRLDAADIMTEAEFAKWYRQKNERQFDPTAITMRETAPYNSPDSLFTQKMGFEIMKVRDMAICRAIAEALKRHDRVMVVYGAGHFGLEQNILEEMLGKPETEASQLKTHD